MFEVTEKASEMIKDFLKDREEFPPIRLMMSQGGWSGPSLGLALDELKDGDEAFDDRGLTFVVEKEFYEKIKPIKVDYIEMDKSIPSNKTIIELFEYNINNKKDL